MPTIKRIVAAEWHRNGISGAGFYAVIFEEKEHGRMIASLFDEPGHCAVYQMLPLLEQDVAFGSNSWRGDEFEAILRPAVKRFLKKQGG